MIRWIRTTETDTAHQKLFRKALIITLIGNIFLAAIKSIAAISSKSAAIYADTFNSISDVFYSILLIIGLWVSQKPPDISHPQGHGRFEPVTALIVTISMGLAGGEALRSSIVRFLSGGTPIQFDIFGMSLFISILIKAGMFWSINSISSKLSSPGLRAAANDNITDVATSIAAILGVFGSSLIHPLLDPLAGVLVSFWIFRSVWQTAGINLGYLTGAGADPNVRQMILDTVKPIDGVKNVHHIITEYAGPRLVVEMHINVDGSLSLDRAHEICDEATMRIENLEEVDRAYVHLEPIGYD